MIYVLYFYDFINESVKHLKRSLQPLLISEVQEIHSYHHLLQNLLSSLTVILNTDIVHSSYHI